MLGTACKIEIGHITAVHTFLDGKVEHRLLVAVLDTRYTGLVTLLVVELHILNDGDRQVLQRRFRVAKHKFLSVDEDLLHLFAIDGDITILIDLSARHTFDEFLDGGALRRAESIGIEDECILLDDDLCSTARDDSLLEHNALRRHEQCAEFLVLVTTQGHVTLYRLKTH